ncbi:MAG: hypothetical protein EOO72_07515 [Myxococcaceae bacterium]|uniref:BioF2-like acetyltransferase domain-containing protein n=1 Tax=Corallococcus coralloides TaxID=184914 RepID=A0A410S1B0_CORCK|nr:hypothetical protein [Corallococcus coralloides]QAT87997.1 hypothetical protein EJ065_6468 [Corallococcus coralloides]RYZ42112.1 MAG: hypothetical protein EOO72_07515 [Myxococcaceae bacterium]
MVLSLPQLRDVAEARFTCLTERELAERRREEGVRVISHRGHYWEQSGAPGFFQPVHLLARLTPEEATPPTPLAWGYRAALTPETANVATGKVPVVRLKDLDTYDMSRLNSNRRSKLRKCQRTVRIVQLTGPSLLLEQGYPVVRDALTRTQHKKIPTLDEYLKGLRQYFTSDHWCVLAGMVDDKLGGYLDGYIVDGVAYGFSAYYATWALPTNISTGLIYEFAQVCRRLGARTLVGGLHAREAAQLEQFKDELGFVVDPVPIQWGMNPLARALIRWRRPHAYYRLTGQA